ncbi:MAG: serine/threonine protein kinase [Pirellulales bacterium]|nr:serine/threonine protein kinase [Pirellulales bacterium]
MNAHPSLPELRRLLDENAAVVDADATASHLDVCTACQSRLTSLAAEESWWKDVRVYLDGNDEPRWEPEATSPLVISDDGLTVQESLHETVRGLLGTPSHPEMLGRLGRYDIERVIGSGGMGIVLKAHDSELNRPIAIKLLAPHLAHVGAARERFAREGRAAAAVVHEHVVAIHNVESDGKAPFLVMQYVPGRSLQTRVDEDGPLAVEEILRIGVQAASGLAAAHRQGLIHRDVKPANILLENQVERAILTDFGLARTIDDASLTQTGILAGTPHYMSPEQASGELIDFRSDLFSLGAVLYFMATGHPPFRANGAMAVLHRLCHEKHRPVWQANKDIPDELSDVVDRLLEKKPSRRPATADEVQQELATLLSRVQQQGLTRRRLGSWRSRRMRRRVWDAAATISLIVAAIGVTSWWNSVAPEGSGPPTVGTVDENLRNAAAIEGAEVIQLDTQFFDGLAEAQDKLEAIQRQALYLQQGDSRWEDAVKSLQRDLETLESNPSLSK